MESPRTPRTRTELYEAMVTGSYSYDGKEYRITEFNGYKTLCNGKLGTLVEIAPSSPGIFLASGLRAILPNRHLSRTPTDAELLDEFLELIGL